ncbi:hypothetical protein QOT17_003095 [Balamuthia mandrillaris]
MVAPHLEGYWWMGEGAALKRSGYGRGGMEEQRKERVVNTQLHLSGTSRTECLYLPPGGTEDDFKVAFAMIEKRILDVVKEGRPLIIGRDWNTRVGKGLNGRGESTYNIRGKVLVESFKRLASCQGEDHQGQESPLQP